MEEEYMEIKSTFENNIVFHISNKTKHLNICQYFISSQFLFSQLKDIDIIV